MRVFFFFKRKKEKKKENKGEKTFYCFVLQSKTLWFSLNDVCFMQTLEENGGKSILFIALTASCPFKPASNSEIPHEPICVSMCWTWNFVIRFESQYKNALGVLWAENFNSVAPDKGKEGAGSLKKKSQFKKKKKF